jgi:hypothetical protein
MIFRQRFLDGIRDGRVTLAFRRWRRPTVKSGGTLLTAVGELQIARVATVSPDRITEADARRAGYESRTALLDELNARAEGDVYRIELGSLGADPRVALRASPAGAAEQQALLDRLQDQREEAEGARPDREPGGGIPPVAARRGAAGGRAIRRDSRRSRHTEAPRHRESQIGLCASVPRCVVVSERRSCRGYLCVTRNAARSTCWPRR